MGLGSSVRTAALALGLTALGSGLSGQAEARVRIDPQHDQPLATKEVAPPMPQPGMGLALRAGYFGGVVPGGGLEAVYASPSWEFSLAGYYGTADLSSALSAPLSSDTALASYRVTTARLSAAAAVVQARREIYDHLSLSLGFGYLRLTGQVVLSGSDQSTLRSDVLVQTVFATTAVGSYWSWPSGVFAGVDWFGIDLPLSHSYDEETTSSGTPAGSARTRFDGQAADLSKTLATAPGLILALASAGYRW